MGREILFAEVPGFYAAVERADDPRLAGRPVVVGGDPRKRGRVQAATSDALAAGVYLDMPILEALQRCPGARAVPTDMQRYREVDRRFLATLRRIVARIESFGLGAGFADLAGVSARGEEIAEAMRSAVRETLSLPLRVGLASGKFLARLAAQEIAEEGVRRIAAGDENRFLAPLRETCKDCKIVLARCERELDGMELALSEHRPVPLPVVSGPGVRMSIGGPGAPAKASCEQIATQMVRNGLRSAACVRPA